MPPPLPLHIPKKKKTQRNRKYIVTKKLNCLGMGFGGTEFTVTVSIASWRGRVSGIQTSFKISGALLGTCRMPPCDAPLLLFMAMWSLSTAKPLSHPRHYREIFTVV